VPELGVELFQGDRLAGLIPGRVGLSSVLGILRRMERLDHRLRDDGGNTLTRDGQVSDDATASVRDSGPHSVTVSGNVTNRFTHSSQFTEVGLERRRVPASAEWA
jgi:hypothetical protein